MVYRVFIAGVEYGRENIINMSINSSTMPDNTFGVGYVYSKALNITVAPIVNIPVGAEIRVEVFFDGAWVSRGLFFIQRRRTTPTLVTLECYDKVLQMEQPFLQTTDIPDFPMPMTKAMNVICTRLGLVLDAVINPDFVIEYVNEMSMRDVVRNIASAHGANAYIAGLNTLKFVELAGSGQLYDVGKDAQSFAIINDIFTISRVTMFWSDDNESYFTAGDDTGRELVAFNDWATQEIVNSVLVRVKDYSHKPFTSTNATINPAFMLGDVVTIDGSTHRIFTAKERYSATVTYDLSAPGEDIIDNEYPYMGTYEKAIRQRLITGKAYYGASIDRVYGLRILRSDGVSRTLINSDVWEAEFDGVKRLYFDIENGQFIFNGQLGADVIIAQEVIVQNFYAENGAVANLTVDALRTDYERAWNYLDGNTSPINYIIIDNEEYKMITAETDGSLSEQFRSGAGELLWWRNNEIGSTMTTVMPEIEGQEPEPVMVYVYKELTKYENTFRQVTLPGGGTTVTPLMKFGAGVGVGDYGKLHVWKAGTAARIRYITSNGVETELRAEDDGKWYYNGLEVASGLWRGTEEEYNALPVDVQNSQMLSIIV